MCIRDRAYCDPTLEVSTVGVEDGTVGVESIKRKVGVGVSEGGGVFEGNICLLYTSDAADERSSVDLGGRSIIKKKHKVRTGWWSRVAKEKPKK